MNQPDSIVLSDHNPQNSSPLLLNLNNQINNPGNPYSSLEMLDFENIPNREKRQNVINVPSLKREMMKFLRTFLNLFNFLLLVQGALSFAGFGVTEKEEEKWVYFNYGMFFIGLIIINSLMVFYQEQRFRFVDTFQSILSQKCEILHEGSWVPIATQNLVEGDTVRIEAGSMIPADLRIISNHNLKIQQSDINGESDFIEVCTQPNNPEKPNKVFAGSKCVEGKGKGVVLKIGNKTYLGDIAQTSCGILQDKKSAIQKQLGHITMFVFVMNCIFMVLAKIFNKNISFEECVSISFGNIPQALGLTTTLCLTIVARRLSFKKIVLKRLECLENLSSAGVILCDKTGTLTLNKMTVLNFWYNKLKRPIKSIEETYRHDENAIKRDKTWRIIFMTACLCNSAKTIGNSLELEGDSVDQALLRFCLNVDPDSIYKYQKKYSNPIFNIPFKSARKFQITVRSYGNGKKCLLMKGAHEEVLNYCSFYMLNGQKLQIDESFKTEVKNICHQEFGKQGERILAVAYKKYALGDETTFTISNCPSYDLTFIGVFSCLDPPKPGVDSAITSLKKANLKIHMITGDHASTAESLAKRVGILQEDELPVVVTGEILKDYDDIQWNSLLKKNEIIFARVSPEEKLQIVKKFREHEKVIMIGDGANDAKALQEADVGIVIGEHSSTISQDVADIIIKKDEFYLVVHCIVQARILFENLKNAVAYTLAHCILELVPSFLSAGFGMPQGMSNLQMLVIDLGTEIIPAISLAFHQTKENIMERQPRNPNKDTMMFGRLLLQSYVFVGSIELLWCLFSYFMNFAFNNFKNCTIAFGEFLYLEDYYRKCDQQQGLLTQVQMAWFTTVVLGQFSNILLMIGVRNIWTLIAVGIELFFLILMLWVPKMKIFFFNENIEHDYKFLLAPWIGTLVMLAFYYEGRRFYVRRHPKGKVDRFFN